FAQCGDCFDRTRHTIFESLRDPRRLHQSPGIVDRLAGHVLARQPFTPANAAVAQLAADDERISVAPLVRRMPDRALERNADVVRGESGDGHGYEHASTSAITVITSGKTTKVIRK